ncbi:MAG: UDP-N-acetylmuramate dehydrogenase [Anaerolineales bacterium]
MSVDVLLAKFGDKVKENVSLAPYTSARIGGPADYLIIANSSDELAEIIKIIWQEQLPYFILGGGSNVLVSDKGLRGLTVLNRAKAVRFENGDQPKVWVESGVVFSNLANRCASRSFSGLEWAATVPGTIGGAVYGNAGAFGGDTSGNLIWAEILTESSRERWSVEEMAYGYRTSILKRGAMKAIILSAELSLKNATKEEVSAKIGQFSERRKSSQPPGASMGSMFKNPQGDFAGRLIEAAGLKGTRIGNAEISTVHGNFFVNHGKTKASDIRALIELTQKTVKEKFDVALELEIELVGEW